VAVARLLRPAPAHFLAAEGAGRRGRGARPCWGSFTGPLPAVELPGLTLSGELLRRKRWLWGCLAGSDLLVAFAVVRTGYAASAFVTVMDPRSMRLAGDAGWTGPSFLARVTDDPHAAGLVARFAAPRVLIEVTRAAPGSGLDVHLRIARLDLELDAHLAEDGEPPPLAVIADLGAGCLDATEKRALLPVRGRALAEGRRYVLDGTFGGYDYTQGLLPRRTRWRWAFGMGRTVRGEPLGFNVAQGFVGEAECAVFDGSGVHGISAPEITFDPSRPAEPWSVRGPGLDLAFRVAGVHTERRRLGLVRTDFLQPAGVFEGTIEVGGRVHEVRDVPGVVEDQDVLW
jgi:hypothetical protein